MVDLSRKQAALIPADGRLQAGPAPVPNREAFFAVTAGFLGWALDAFDFFLVVIALPRIAAEFHVKPSAIAFSLTLTLMFRPVGAFLFGLMADRYGRRIPMMLDLLFYSAVEVATGFAPDLTTFLVLRALFGIGMGGEWGVGTSLVMEKVPARWRGVLSGFRRLDPGARKTIGCEPTAACESGRAHGLGRHAVASR